LFSALYESAPATGRHVSVTPSPGEVLANPAIAPARRSNCVAAGTRTAGWRVIHPDETNLVAPKCRLAVECLEDRLLPSALTVTPAALRQWDVSQPGYQQTLGAYGASGPITYAVSSGTLPGGMSLTAGVLAGTPVASGTFPFTISATAAGGATGSRAYTLVVNSAPTLDTPNAPVGDAGRLYRLPMVATGGTAPYTFKVHGGLPPGVYLTAGTGLIAGTPTAAGTFQFTITLTDRAGATTSEAFSVAINPRLVIGTASLLRGEVGVTYSQGIAVHGGTAPITFQALNPLPPGLTFDTATGVLGGTPTAHGTYALTVQAADSAGAVVRRSYVLSIATVLAVPLVGKPAYLQPMTDPIFGTQITRIAGNAGTAIKSASGTPIGVWSRDARHNYNLNEAWNADGSLIVIENRSDDGGSPDEVYLNGTTYQVEFVTPSNMPGGGSYDQRWNPNPAYPDDVILAGNGTDQLYWFNVVTNTIDRTYPLPMAVTYIGNTKGNPSQDGQFLCLGDLTHLFVVDMNAYPTERIGPVFDLSTLGLDATVNAYSMSPSGNFVVVHYSMLNGQYGDFEEVFNVDPTTLALSPRPMTVSWPGMVGDPALGFVYQLGHEDMALDPFLGNTDVMIGQEHCGNVGQNIPGISTVNSDGIGHIVMVDLSTGAVTSLTDPGNGTTIAPEAYADHVSCRAVLRPGWCYVSYYNEPGDRFSDEIIAVKMDGSGTVEQLADTHTLNDVNVLPQSKLDPDFAYRSEAHPEPSPDGTHVLFASNWLYQGVGGAWIGDYVIQVPPSGPANS
jgi:hypothetical protein